MLIGLWIYAYSRGIGSARELARRCRFEPAFQWLTGLGEINYHTRSDFRVAHAAALQELFAQVLGVLSAEGLVTLERVMHDGTKIKACAGADSFRREERLREPVAAARAQVAAMGDPRAEESPRQRAARQRAARERQVRLAQAQAELVGGVERVEQNLEKKPGQMVSDGGFTSRENIVAMAALGVDFIGSIGERASQSVGQRRRRGVAEAFYPDAFEYDAAADGYRCPAGERLRHESREQRPGVVAHQYRAAAAVCAACRFKAQCCPRSASKGRCLTRAEAAPAVRAFAEKMQTAEAKAIYRQRGPIAEFPNAWIKAKVGLRQFHVRGLAKVLVEVLWACLAYNLAQWIRLRWRSSLAAAS